MSIDIILYILTIMIFWDFSSHVIQLLGFRDKFLKSKSLLSYYYPHFRWRKTPNGPIERKNGQKYYDIFWTLYWGLAFVLLLVYIFLK
jgi:hypothetical protein